MSYVIFFTRFTLLIVFCAALGGKVHSKPAWSAFVTATGMLLGVARMRATWAATAAVAEGATVVCLTVNEAAYAGLILALVNLSLFTVIVFRGVSRGVQTACNCFGTDGTVLGRAHVWRNLILVCVAAIGTGAAEISPVPSIFAGAAYATPVVLSVVSAAAFVMWDDVTYLIGGAA